ncbi:MAG TPA: aldo/keto reductase, partial [Spirochaetia bacterium]|nr:aldo/keto reductase [Spirochaetia bacterium]
MKYRRLGRSGLQVSELSYGSWVTFGNQLDVEGTKKLIRQAVDAGVNFLDNAEGYASGMSESLMGVALKSYRREDLVVSTKIFWGGSGPNQTGLSRKHLLEGTRNSLKRLQLDYVDLLFCHRPDPNTPIEETVLAMDSLVRSGQTLYWGTSEWSADQITQAIEFAKDYRAIAPVMEQPQYNMLVRNRFEKEYAPVFEKYRYGTTIWSPLASGLLSGK